MHDFFSPDSIAIIGASQDLNSISGRPIRYMLNHGFPGKIYPINPKYETIGGLKCYAGILDVPGPVDVALVAVNNKRVINILNDCGEKGVKLAVIFSSGFAETGEEGEKLQREMLRLKEKYGMRVLGPNCQGYVNAWGKVPAGFSAALEGKPLIPGPIGLISQSGAIGYAVFNLAQENGLGFSHVISTGNEADIHSVELLKEILEDDKTEIVFTYLEGIKDGKLLLQTAERALELNKPMIALKSGRSEVGRQAIGSHTASLTGTDKTIDAVFKQLGIVRVDDIQDFIDIANIFQNASLPKGERLGILTTSGGAGILAADAAIGMGLQVPSLDAATTASIKKNIPDFGSALNPVDVTGQVINDPEGFKDVLSAMLASPDIDAVIILVTMIYGSPGIRLAENIVAAARQAEKPIISCWAAGDQLMDDCFQILQKGNVPNFKSPARCVKALGSLMKYSKFRDSWLEKRKSAAGISTTVKTKGEKLLSSGGQGLSEYQSKRILAEYGVPVTKEQVAASEEDAAAIAVKMDYPVVLKIDSPDILHKTEAKAVALNISDDDQLRKAYREVLSNARDYNPDAKINGVLVQEMVPPGVEVIVGIKNDPIFGPLVVFGIGGIFTEVFEEVSMRLAPLKREDAMEMIKENRSYKLLIGARNQQRMDLEALADLLQLIAKIAVDKADEIAGLDLNPVIVLPEGQGVKACDALIIPKNS